MTAAQLHPADRRRVRRPAGLRRVGRRAGPAGAGAPGRRADRRGRLRARRRGPADGAGLRDAGDAGPQRPDACRTSTSTRSTRRSPRPCWPTLKAWEDPAFCKGKLGLDAAAGLDRPLEAQRQRLVAGGRAPVRRDRRPDRRPAGQDAARGGPGQARPDLHLRRRRPGRRRHPRVLTAEPATRSASTKRPSEGTTPVSDWYRDFANSGVGTTITKQLGLPRPAVLRRYEPGQPLLPGPAVIGSAGEGRLRDALTKLLHGRGRARAVAGHRRRRHGRREAGRGDPRRDRPADAGRPRPARTTSCRRRSSGCAPPGGC